MGIAIPEDMIFILRRGPGYALENTMNSVSQPDTKKMIHNNDKDSSTTHNRGTFGQLTMGERLNWINSQLITTQNNLYISEN